jgi:hypothetical protein
MTTFTLRLTAPLAQHVSSARMRSWIAEFLREPHSLPPDPGPGEDRLSLTLPGESVQAVAGFLHCTPSEALRRHALKATQPSRAVRAAQRHLAATSEVWAQSADPTWDETEDGEEDAKPRMEDVIFQVSVSVFFPLLLCALLFFLRYRERKRDNMTVRSACFRELAISSRLEGRDRWFLLTITRKRIRRCHDNSRTYTFTSI